MERYEIKAAILKVMIPGRYMTVREIAKKAGLDPREVWDLCGEMWECALMNGEDYYGHRVFLITALGLEERKKIDATRDD